MAVTSLLLTLIFGGVAGAFATWWLARERPQLSMISIAKAKDSNTTVRVPQDVVDLTRDFTWGPDLDTHSRSNRVEREIQACQEFANSCPSGKQTVSELLKEVPQAADEDERLEAVQKIAGSWIITTVIHDGLYRKQFDPGGTSDSRTPNVHELNEEGSLFEVLTTPQEDGTIKVLIDLPQKTGTWVIGGDDAHFRLKSASRFLGALQQFDQNAITACLEYAQQVLERESLRVAAIVSTLERSVELGPFEIDAVATNKGNRLAVVNPYASLVTRGADKKIAPILLRVDSFTDGQGKSTEIPTSAPHYLSLAPQSTVKLVLVSEALDNNVQLKSAYDSGILQCSISMVEQKVGRRGKTFRSPWKRFGIKLEEELREDAMKAAK
ncbi:hypothetical protein JS756_12500 [Streptomyces actuosus]|uniref:Uncharacterized protein n=1 Tax=Streptomyces actuosus TaxID=1885 RepID=A0ABS2VPE9_STRAS|nr:hypothetical protein [Streptomyces actuosus]MBN0044914.1 hypothetical protein [Streptomyces actuosus]